MNDQETINALTKGFAQKVQECEEIKEKLKRAQTRIKIAYEENYKRGVLICELQEKIADLKRENAKIAQKDDYINDIRWVRDTLFDAAHTFERQIKERDEVIKQLTKELSNEKEYRHRLATQLTDEIISRNKKFKETQEKEDQEKALEYEIMEWLDNLENFEVVKKYYVERVKK